MTSFTKRTTWTTFSSANDGLAQNFIDQSYQLGRFIGERNDNYCFGGGLCGLMGAVYKGVVAVKEEQNGSDADKSHIIAVPYHIYHVASDDPYFQQVHVKQDLKDQQKHLSTEADHLVALPGGIGTRGEIWNTLEELRCNKEFADKTLWIVNIDDCYQSFIDDIDMMKASGLAKQSDFSRMHVVNTVDALRLRFDSNG